MAFQILKRALFLLNLQLVISSFTFETRLTSAQQLNDEQTNLSGNLTEYITFGTKIRHRELTEKEKHGHGGFLTDFVSTLQMHELLYLDLRKELGRKYTKQLILLLEDCRSQVLQAMRTDDIGDEESESSEMQGEQFKSFWSQGITNDYSCRLCRNRMGNFLNFLDDVQTYMMISVVSTAGCWFKSNLRFCINVFPPSVHQVLDSFRVHYFRHQFFCFEVIKMCPGQGEYRLELPNKFVEQLMKTKPDQLKDNQFINNEYDKIKRKENSKILKFVQFTDVHMDLEYKEGTLTACKEPICCRKESGYPIEGQKYDTNKTIYTKAGSHGAFGDQGCGIPLITFRKMIEYIKSEIHPDVVFWTGDIVPHDLASHDYDEIQKYSQIISNVLNQDFKDYDIHAILGNHDYEEVSQQDFSSSSDNKAILLQIEQVGQKMFHDQEALHLYEKFGYTSQNLRIKGKIYENIKIIYLNSQACYGINNQLYKTLNDPGDQIAWLSNLLMSMEKVGQIGMIVMHIPPGNTDCIYQWSIRLRALLDRYQNVVRFSINGHSHLETYNLVRSFPDTAEYFNSFDMHKGLKNGVHVDVGQPVMVQYTSGAASTYNQLYPTFRVYHVDEETLLPIKIDTHKINVHEENPEWKYDHSLPELFSMPDLSPSSFQQLAYQIEQNEQLAIKFNNYRSNGGLENRITDCDETCRLFLSCFLQNSVFIDFKLCQKHRPIEVSNVALNRQAMFAIHWIIESLTDPWYTLHA